MISAITSERIRLLFNVKRTQVEMMRDRGFEIPQTEQWYLDERATMDNWLTKHPQVVTHNIRNNLTQSYFKLAITQVQAYTIDEYGNKTYLRDSNNSPIMQPEYRYDRVLVFYVSKTKGTSSKKQTVKVDAVSAIVIQVAAINSGLENQRLQEEATVPPQMQRNPVYFAPITKVVVITNGTFTPEAFKLLNPTYVEQPEGMEVTRPAKEGRKKKDDEAPPTTPKAPRKERIHLQVPHQLFSEKELRFSPIQGVNTPTHIRLTPEAARKQLATMKVRPTQLPFIDVLDPIAYYYDWSEGDLIICQRINETFYPPIMNIPYPRIVASIGDGIKMVKIMDDDDSF